MVVPPVTFQDVTKVAIIGAISTMTYGCALLLLEHKEVLNEDMLKYNLCLIQQGHRILLLNRERSSWMGCWNGIGGKLEANEQPRAAMQREMEEETGLASPELTFKGIITWSNPDGSHYGGMYLYLALLAEEIDFHTPMKTDEGILDWKSAEWITHPENQGIASNISRSLDRVLHDRECYHYHSIFIENELVDQLCRPISAQLEWDEKSRQSYLIQFMIDYKAERQLQSTITVGS